MFSFNGDFRRRPQQDMAGASRNNQRDALLQRAQAERQKREEERRRKSSMILLQAFVRGCMTRAKQRRKQRLLFDDTVKQINPNTPNNDKIFLSKLLNKLLFFYRQKEDPLRLIWMSAQLLKWHELVKTWCCCGIEQEAQAWRWRLRKLLHITMVHLVHASPGESGSGAGKESLAVPLRLLEVFTNWQSLIHPNLLSPEAAVSYTCQHFLYLVNRDYFKQLRQLLDSRVPPLMEASPNAPTPLSSCLFDMLTRPLILSQHSTNPSYMSAVLKSFSDHILKPSLTDSIRMFVIPALSNLQVFPYTQLLKCLYLPYEQATISLLYAVLALDKTTPSANWSPLEALNYVQVLGWLTEQITPDKQKTLKDKSGQESDSDDDDDVLTLANSKECRLTKQIAEDCMAMLNEAERVQNILQAMEKWPTTLMRHALSQICHNLLLYDKFAIHNFRLMYTLAFKPAFLRDLWQILMNTTQATMFAGSAGTPLVRVLARGLELAQNEIVIVMPQLATFCSLFSLLLRTMHDDEFCAENTSPGTVTGTMPFTLEELVPLSTELKGICLGLIRLAYPESRITVKNDYRSIVRPSSAASSSSYLESKPSTQTWGRLFKAAVELLRQLHARDTRRPFCPPDHWLAREVCLPSSEIGSHKLNLRRNYRPFRRLRIIGPINLEDGPPLSTKEVRNLAVLQEMPFVVAFEERVLLFQTLVIHEKHEFQSGADFLQGTSINIMVRRNYLYEDAFEKLSIENEPELRSKMRVQLVNVAGMDEAGIDGGGLFREFLSELLKTAFDPNRGFFKLTKDNMLYPNPNVHLLHDDFVKHYFFIGRILGKALFENLLVELPLAEFFLSKLVCGAKSDVGVHQLASLDPVMYRSLLYLKNYEGDVIELGLDFTVVSDELGETRIDELKPGGANIPVTATNRIEYIHLIADYKLNKQIRAQCNAFKQGLANVIPLEWLQMFNNKEIQVLISGAHIPVNVADLRQHSIYSGGYGPDHPTIIFFWRVVDQLNDLQRRQLLKFVTSCSRPPLLGFKELQPPFCIQHAGTPDRLPTASTCMNLLKLPEFKDEETLRAKLLYAIQSGAGFELS